MQWKLVPLRTNAFCCLLLSSLLLPVTVEAQKSWFSGISRDGQTRPFSATQIAEEGEGGKRVEVRSTVDGTFIDLMVSIYNKTGDPDYPTGDNDGRQSTIDMDSGSIEQDTYEKIFQFMADAIYESTERKHKLRTIRIFKNGDRMEDADIQWIEKRRKISADVNGAGWLGGHIRMADIFVNGKESANGMFEDANLLDDREGAGYTLAHEMGHYFYGVFDEYVTDDCGVKDEMAVPKTIMNSQWSAKGGNYEWLNYSIAYQSGNPNGDWVNNKKNCQDKRYGESAWETMTRHPFWDTKLLDIIFLFSRPFHPELREVAPTGTNSPVVNLKPGGDGSIADARSDLVVIWATDEIVYEIVLDNSGSMIGSKIADAKTAAKLLVDKAVVGSSQVGVILFNSTASTLVPLTLIDSQATKNALKATIDTVTAGGSTVVGSAAQLALDTLLAAGNTAATNIVFLVSDGISGDNALAPIPAYQNAKIPIFAFAIGTDADTTTLQALATQTGGQMFISPTTLAAVTAAFEQANQSASGLQGLSSGTSSATSATPTDIVFEIDVTVDRFDLTTVHEGGAADATIVLTAPGGTIVPANTITESANETASVFTMDMPQLGEWTISVLSNTGASTEFSYQVTISSIGTAFSVGASSMHGPSISYPTPMLVEAVLEQDFRISNAQVDAVLTAPSGVKSPLALRDDGVSPDEISGDGRYSALVSYSENGTYTIDVLATNFQDTATFTSNGSSTASTEGTAIPQPPDVPVGVRFERVDTIQITVAGVVADDHGNSIASATSVIADNSDTAGKIESAGDVDFFAFVAPIGSLDLSVRVTGLAAGMDPFLVVMDSVGQVLGQGDLLTSSTSGGYLAIGVPVTAGEQYFASVSDTNATAADGIYSISVGPTIVSDPPLAKLSVVTAGLSATIKEGEPTPDQFFILTNAGTGTLRYSITDDAGWLFVFPAHGESTDGTVMITVNFVTPSVPPGVHTGLITISDPAASNSPLTVSVTLTVIADAVPTTGTGGGGGGGGCFIATATYGTPMAQEIEALREVRDTYLLNNAAGAAFVDAYYTFSPPLADYIAEHDTLRALSRGMLYPVVWLAGLSLHSPFAALVLLLSLFGVFGIGTRRLVRTR